MDAIIRFFEGIGTALKSVLDFVISLFKDMAFMVQLLSKFLSSIPDYFGWLPAGVISTLVLIITIAVLYKILGREG